MTRKTYTWKKFYDTILSKINETINEFYDNKKLKTAVQDAIYRLFFEIKDIPHLSNYQIFKQIITTSSETILDDCFIITGVQRARIVSVEKKYEPACVLPEKVFMELQSSSYFEEPTVFSPYAIVSQFENKFKVKILPSLGIFEDARIFYIVNPEIPDYEEATDNPDDFPFEDELVQFLIDYTIGILLIHPDAGQGDLGRVFLEKAKLTLESIKNG